MDVKDLFSKLISENGEIGTSNIETHLHPTLKISSSVLLNSNVDL